MKRFSIFASKVIAVHIVTYFVVGALAYQFLTKEFYVGPEPIFARFMRTEAEPALWSHVTKWFFPAQALRGLLIALALWPFLEALKSMSFSKRLAAIAGLYLLLGFWAAATAAPGTIEGLVYLRPEITTYVHLKVQPEIIAQGLALSALLSWLIGKDKSNRFTE